MHSLEETEIFNAIQILNEGKVLLYPSDTIWGIGGDATKDAVGEKIIQIKERAPEKGIIILVDGIEMLSRYIKVIPNKAMKLIKSSDRPTTIIYAEAYGIAKINKADDGSLAIRVVQDGFIKKLITQFGKPISSSSANISSEPSPSNYNDISDLLKERVDYVVDPQKVLKTSQSKASSIARLKDNGELEWIRV